MAHYYETDKRPLRVEEIRLKVDSQEYTINSASGLFSVKHIDNATQLLIDKAQIKDGESLLDLGCGYGAIGIAIKLRHPSCKVTLSDINKNAIKITRSNAKKLQMEVDVLVNDVLDDISEKFDVIVTNPPYVAGREVCFKFIEQSNTHLNKKGSLQLVARHQKGGKMLSLQMEKVFGNVETIAKQSGFRIYKSIKE